MISMSNLKALAAPLAAHGTLQPASDTHSNPKSSSEGAAIDAAGKHGEYLVLFPTNQSTRQGSVHRDGRVRNPVPNKLKGKTDAKNGNFAVMHMNMPTPESVPRRAATKQANEDTEHVAGWGQRSESLERQQGVALGNQQALDEYPGVSPNSESATSLSMLNKHQPNPSSPQEIKEEQTRLLNLLRNLHPTLVVEQICKALTHFGGLPGAPPPADGIFPESTEANGSGPSFVSWVAEIFPKGQEPLANRFNVELPDADVSTLRRPRGRPKGSKSTKVRKDKGVRKRRTTIDPAQYETKYTPSGTAPKVHDSEWIDLEQESDKDINPTSKSQPSRTLDTESSEVTTGEVGIHHGSSNTLLPAPPGLMDEESASSVMGCQADQTIPLTKRRGRPKGSKNRPKQLHENLTHEDLGEGVTGIPSSDRTMAIAEPFRSTSRKSGPGRPKGSKNRVKQVTDEAFATDKETSPGTAKAYALSNISNMTSIMHGAESTQQGPSPMGNNERLATANGHSSSQGPKRKSMSDDQRSGIGRSSDFRLLGRDIGLEDNHTNNTGPNSHVPSIKRRRISNAQAQLSSAMGELPVEGSSAYRFHNNDPMTAMSKAPISDPNSGDNRAQFPIGLEQGRRAVAGGNNTRSSYPTMKQQQQVQNDPPHVPLPPSSGSQVELPASTNAFALSPANRLHPSYYSRTSPVVSNRPGGSETSADQQQHHHMGAPPPPTLQLPKTTTPGSYHYMPRTGMSDAGNRGLAKEPEYPVRRTLASPAPGGGQFHVNPANDSLRQSPHVPNPNLQRFHGYGNTGYMNVGNSGSGEHQDHMGMVAPHYAMGQASVQGPMPSQAFDNSSRMPQVNFDVSLTNQGLREGLYQEIDRR